jgi:single-stranded-DNA-specific exonuclease
MSGKLTCKEIREILSNRFKDDECNSLSKLPPPSLFKDMQKATKRVAQAIKNGEKIALIGDYDVDGVVSCVIVSEFFEHIGSAINVIIPNRFTDGYGINKKILDRVDATLIITVDNGISAVEAAEICKERGIDLIITDHHDLPSKLPEAYAIVNPKQPDCSFPYSGICGAQVAWYLVASLKSELKIEFDLGSFLDILALSIMADMMELKGMNRAMVRSGFNRIKKSDRAFFKAVKSYFSKDKFKSDDISFLLSPIINSAGRLKDASLSFNLLRAKELDEAMVILERLVMLNNRRKEIESEIFNDALKMVEKDQKIAVVWSEGWHEGVIGIVAARLTRRLKIPAIVFSVDGDKAKGSARSVGDIDILSLISSCSEFLEGFGGHKGAAGMSIETKNLNAFKSALEREVREIEDERFIDSSEILGELDASSIGFELLEILESFEPYGVKNPLPKFVIKDAIVSNDRVLGNNSNHLKMRLRCDRVSVESIYFNFDKKVREGDRIDIVCSVNKNEFRGEISPQLMVESLKVSR